MDDEGVTADRQVVTGAVWEPSVVAFFLLLSERYIWSLQKRTGCGILVKLAFCKCMIVRDG